MLTKTPSETLAATAFADAKPPGTFAGNASKRPRDPRLDVFRGLGMLIILIAHIPDNTWTLWIPARFGFSDATEMFVFLSGMASAIAFGRLADREGLAILSARVVHRIWQIYWSHIAVFVTILALMVVADSKPEGVPLAGMTYAQSLNLLPFLDDPSRLIVGLLTLTYVPNYFDILPMYMVILALIPLMLLAERLHKSLPFLMMGGLWALAQAGFLSLSAEPWTARHWFFNPFGWQLLFFLGFFFMRGTLPAPPVRRWLTWLAIVFLVVTVPFAWYRIHVVSPFFHDAALRLVPLTDKTVFGALRLIHFLALAYITLQLAGENGRRLKGPVVDVLRKVGQQSLAVFIAGMVLAQVLGIFLDHAGRTGMAMVAANLAGFAILIAVAYVVSWFKAAPWKA